MPLMFVAALMLAQAQAVSPNQPGQAAPIIVSQKKKQVCEFVESSGSRMRERVCHDVNGDLALAPNVTNNMDNAGLLHAMPGPAKGGVGGTPQ